MSLAGTALAAAGALAAAAAAARLLRGQTGHDASVKHGYRLLAATAILWSIGQAVQAAAGNNAPPPSLTWADVPQLVAVLPLVAGIGWLAGMAVRPAGAAVTTRLQCVPEGVAVASALFIVGWVAEFGALYERAGGAAAFATELAHPLVDLLAIAAVLGAAVQSGRLGVLPFGALAAVTVGDSLAVGGRVSGAGPGVPALLLQIAGCLLLAAVPSVTAAGRNPLPPSAVTRTVNRAAVLWAAAAACAMLAWVMLGGSAGQPAMLGAAAVMVLALAVTAALRRDGPDPARRDPDGSWQFRELAERASEIVCICAADGTIRYASPAVAGLGYQPERLTGRRLAEMLHPDDMVAGASRFGAALRGIPPPGRFGCRIRARDGTWRHVEATIAGYPGGQDAVLITATDVSDTVALREQVRQLKFHDGLTGLPNRAFVEERLKEAATRRSGEPGPGAAILLDLDGFTSVNDSAGHRAGDLVLAQAARRLRAVARPADILARWGGDEFAVLVEAPAADPEVTEIAKRLCGVIAAEPFAAADREIVGSASAGVALAASGAAADLLRNARIALSHAKQAGAGRVEVYEARMHAEVVRRLELASDLRQAITGRRITLDFQPIVELASMRVTGVEALARWRRDGALVPAAEFLGVAEQTGLIGPLGDLVLRQACEQAASWRTAGLPLSLSVNFSLRQVSAPGFTGSVLAVLDQSGLPPGALTVEIAERVLLDGGGWLAEALAALRRHGVRLAIDDFGTGYASLGHLRRHPVDIVKIDASFVAGLPADSAADRLTRAIVGVGHDLGIEVVAEGLERPEQRKLLLEMGCRLGQGFLLAPPMPAAGIADAVRDGMLAHTL
jgi:diguanylate cyclase (GGDEF)-like protein/PAS domain S-box-containing protein